MKSLKFIYNETTINFTSTDTDVMVNATEMAKVFGKDVFQFTRIDDTKEFINACLKPQNCGLLGIESMPDLIVSKQKSGTWMHRVLALKFAAWLDHDFEVWVFSTIDQIILGHYREVKEATLQKMELEQKRNQMRDELLKQYPAFVDFLELEGQINTEEKKRLKALRAATSQLRFEFSEKQR